METTKSTHSEYRTELFMPIMKETDGSYIAVLSDDSVDRDEERVSKGCIEKLGQDGGYLAALCNHKNDVFMQVASWTNRGVRQIGDNTALIAVPKFFKSNPNAKIIQGMLDEGAEIGISIGAIVNKYEDVEENGKEIRTFTELELLEASFVAVPSNRHGRALAVAKSYNNKKGGQKMSDDKIFTQKDMDGKVSELDKAHKEKVAELEKSVQEKEKEIADLGKKLETAQKSEEDAKSEAKEAKDEAEKAKKASLEKQKFADQGGEDEKEPSEEDIDKAFKDGKLPIGRL